MMVEHAVEVRAKLIIQTIGRRSDVKQTVVHEIKIRDSLALERCISAVVMPI